MILAAVHLHPLLTIPVGIAAGLWMLWYWRRLGSDDVPASRRRIRRLSMGLMLLALPMFGRALSFLDPAIEPRQYAMTWIMALMMTGIVLVLATVDLLNTLRLGRVREDDAVRITALELAKAIARRREQKRLEQSADPEDHDR